ncbi:helix-turn-helix domain-containing protein [Arthrobacter sp. Sa2BUA2]|uniref:Helix-turn-helix domain-containing protein n=1 Tax=Arthrobacter pullicola TaxID=2762224 RepID=A0ABR8YEH9_9MICC|nr:helix-turn-helix domain-containing protein [Arthrobacter pullicola]MBD8042629.1 helix-turn-helix domain-containing protein [Arthrobacter pullicola]
MDLLTQVVREAPVPLWVIDHQGLVSLANKAAIRFLGYRGEDDVVGGPSHDLLHCRRPDGSPYPEHECPIVGSGGSALASEWFVTRSGDARPVQWTTRSMGSRLGTLLSFSPQPRAQTQMVRDLRSRGPAPRTPAVQVRGELRGSMLRTIEARFTDPEFTTAELAAGAHLSVRSVQAIFAEAGTSPAAEIRRARLEHARTLLAQGSAVQTACLASGFQDPGTFSRAFRQRYGVSPSQVPALSV